MQTLSQRLLESCHYTGKEMLMHINTGSVDTAKWWADQYEIDLPNVMELGELDKEDAIQSSINSFRNALKEVKKDEDGDWVEA